MRARDLGIRIGTLAPGLASERMVGRDGITFHALPRDRLVEVMRRYGRLA